VNLREAYNWNTEKSSTLLNLSCKFFVVKELCFILCLLSGFVHGIFAYALFVHDIFVHGILMRRPPRLVKREEWPIKNEHKCKIWVICMQVLCNEIRKN